MNLLLAVCVAAVSSFNDMMKAEEKEARRRSKVCPSSDTQLTLS
jgi:hypothetical protein